VGKKIVITSGFVKKTKKTPPAEIQRARRYKKDYEERHDG
jgi:phage-related protein